MQRKVNTGHISYFLAVHLHDELVIGQKYVGFFAMTDQHFGESLRRVVDQFFQNGFVSLDQLGQLLIVENEVEENERCFAPWGLHTLLLIHLKSKKGDHFKINQTNA